MFCGGGFMLHTLALSLQLAPTWQRILPRGIGPACGRYASRFLDCFHSSVPRLARRIPWRVLPKQSIWNTRNSVRALRAGSSTSRRKPSPLRKNPIGAGGISAAAPSTQPFMPWRSPARLRAIPSTFRSRGTTSKASSTSILIATATSPSMPPTRPSRARENTSTRPLRTSISPSMARRRRTRYWWT